MILAVELSLLYQRDLTRLHQEIAAFPSQDTLWATVPGISNSAGHLTLHLEGNLREYVGRLIGNVAFARNRPQEFPAPQSRRPGCSRALTPSQPSSCPS